MKTKLVAVMILAAGSAFAETHFSIGIGIGTPGYYARAPYAAARYVVARPPFPGPGYVWIDGYNDVYGRFIPGYWALPPYADAYWIAPRFSGGRFYAGSWGRRGHVGNGFVGRGFDNHFRRRDLNRNQGRRGNFGGNRVNQNRGRSSTRGSRR
jgi:hypothetical protein